VLTNSTPIGLHPIGLHPIGLHPIGSKDASFDTPFIEFSVEPT
jgi:hypothetical protein